MSANGRVRGWRKALPGSRSVYPGFGPVSLGSGALPGFVAVYPESGMNAKDITLI